MNDKGRPRNNVKLAGILVLGLIVVVGVINLFGWVRQREQTTRIDTLTVYSDNTVSKAFVSKSLEDFMRDLPPNTQVNSVRIESLSGEAIVDAIAAETVQPDLVVGSATTIAAIRAEHGETYFGTSGALVPRIVAAERTVLACRDGVLPQGAVNLVSAMEEAGQVGMSDPTFFDATAAILVASSKEQATVYNYTQREARDLVKVIEKHAVVRPADIGAQELDAIGGMLGNCVVVDESQALASEVVGEAYTIHELELTQWEGLYVSIVRDRPLTQKQVLLHYIEDVLFSAEWQKRFAEEGVTGVKQNLSTAVSSTLISVNTKSIQELRNALGEGEK